MQLEEFNALESDDARACVDPCLGVERWVRELVAGRPYGDLAALVDQARASAENLTDDELAAALRRHPRLGERLDSGDAEAAYSEREQGGLDNGDDVGRLLTDGNRRYEHRFDRVFLIRASGRDSAEILAELDRRLSNDDETERREVVSALRQIALLRLEQVVEP
ncbi:MAG: 2-oxo-4-hydroxy-4-carboxy-5-ureidoimidazoline decarboxylase [Propionibacteriales bacterium]|nr:2-oxo-4-hydroxy-4-carboxy-5-ureidoimidazoline decarboxylase [Propionibacteriales bacterium]